MLEQFFLTPAAGKRLIAKALAAHPAVRAALRDGTVAIVAGTTNGYAAEELLAAVGQGEGFSRRRFFRGVTLPPGRTAADGGSPPHGSGFPGDVIIVRGRWQKGVNLLDIAGELKEGDVILKGANALDLTRRQAAVLVAMPDTGTIGLALMAAVGRRVRLILPVGLEKRAGNDLMAVAAKLNAPGARGLRLLPVPGEVLTEIEAVALLTGAEAELVAAGGVGGAEGGIWLAVSGTSERIMAAGELLKSVASEPLFEL